MPHVIVKLYPGRTEDQKIKLAKEIVKDVIAIAKCEEKSVSVAIEEIEKEDWAEKVYKPDILNNKGSAAFTKNQDIAHLDEAGPSLSSGGKQDDSTSAHRNRRRLQSRFAFSRCH